MRITLSSVPVLNQAKALEFYTNKLGFVVKNDIPMGEYRWLSLLPGDGSNDVELLLEPVTRDDIKTFQKSIYDDGIPWTQFDVDDVQASYEQLTGAGVEFKGEPKDIGPAIYATLDDTCGNLIMLVQMKE